MENIINEKMARNYQELIESEIRRIKLNHSKASNLNYHIELQNKHYNDWIEINNYFKNKGLSHYNAIKISQIKRLLIEGVVN